MFRNIVALISRLRRAGTLLALLLLLLSAMARPAAAQYTITAPDAFGPYTGYYIENINNRGEVVGELRDTNGYWRGFLWLPVPAYGLPAGINLIPTLGGTENAAKRINNNGDIVGASRIASGEEHGFLYSSGVLQDIGVRLSMGLLAGINDRREIVGRDLDTNRAVLWLPVPAYGLSAGKHDLGKLGGTFSHAMSINNLGLISGSSDKPDGPRQRGVIWENGIITTLPEISGRDSYQPYFLNDRGQIVGYAYSTTDDTQHAILWEKDASGSYVAIDLGDFGEQNASGVSINSQGQIIIVAQPRGTSVGDPSSHSHLWQDGRVTNINDLIPAGSGWTYIIGWKINDAGQITGLGYHSGNLRPFVLTPVPNLVSLSVSPNPVPGCKTATGTVTLKTPAPPGGAVVTLASMNPAAHVPPTVIVPAGKASATFLITTDPVTAPVTGKIIAKLGAQERKADLTVRPISVKTLTLVPGSIIGGNNAAGVLTLECTAPYAIPVTLSSSNPAVANLLIGSATIPAGTTSVAFTIKTSPVAVDTSVVLRATANGLTRSATLKVRPPGIASLTLVPSSVNSGENVVGVIVLDNAVGPGGRTIALTSSNPGAASVDAATLTIPEGDTIGYFNITTHPVASTTHVTLKAVVGGSSRSAALTVNP